ncbi:RsmB/NOP family class I SAM-dependent RNA methyltransferase [Stagnimonas aquatica]|uniref:RsmB/NOP family class I SAM-dependent RNA methyltransferase n=1 Tax=Stagnimonas aquatica TaxID=2689987 RepID=A0A3N0VL56_9GAMM|nr:RsmB/NOP family class I SAM-dependent RNA methyltransferase [Stagnimonas aquatica]ROH93441.1 RsmB/NOP family class I SAM-dependent RNA methyltransferase [Stagnimonas aquatica]
MSDSPSYRRAHVARARAALADIASGGRPADQILDALFRSHREMGKRDRAQVSALVYGVLRDALRLQVLTGTEPAAWLARHLADLGADPSAYELPAAAALAPVSAAAEANLPEPIHAAFLAQYGEDETRALAQALNREAPADLRANTLKLGRDALLAQLADEGIAATATPLSPWGIRLSKRIASGARVFAEGLAEPQDEGSQLLALLVAAQPGETVIDFCAGAGGKTLALAAAMRDRGRLVAADSATGRLARLSPRLERAGVAGVEARPLAADDPEPFPDLVGQADAVLVDAPCSGTGTWRRNPELRLRPVDTAALAGQQLAILERAARLVRPGGRLVYATCSLLAAENEAVVDAFLARHPDYAPDPAAGQHWPPLAALLGADRRLRLLPHRHGSDGFFAAPLRRQPA